MRAIKRLLAALLVTGASLVGFSAAAPAATNASDGSACTTWLRGIDVSSSQPSVNWADVKSYGIAFAYVKATQGTWYTNPYAPGQETGAVKVGIPFGNYDFAQPGLDNAVADAKYFVLHSNSKAQLPPALDLEVTYTSNSATIAWAVAWIHEVEGLTGRTVTVYTGAYYGFSQSTAISSIATLWIAAYSLGSGVAPPGNNPCSVRTSPATGVWPTWVVYQYTDHGAVYGIGNLDTDATTASWLRKFSTLGVVLVAPGTTKTPAGIIYTLGSSGPQVVLIEKLMKSEGLYTGPIDGKFGPALLLAVETYEGPKFENLPAKDRNSGWTPYAAQISGLFLIKQAAVHKATAIRLAAEAKAAAAKVAAAKTAAAKKAAEAKAAAAKAAAAAAAAVVAAYKKAHPVTTTTVAPPTTTSTTTTTVPGSPTTTTTSDMGATGTTTPTTSTTTTTVPSPSMSLPSSPAKGGGGGALIWYILSALFLFGVPTAIELRRKGKF